jgi:uncharacterized protein (DUF302 family)
MSGARIISISCSEPGEAATAFQNFRVSKAPFEEVIWRLREAIETTGFWVLQEIDSKMLLKRGGYGTVPVRQILFFHPRFMARILEADSAAVLEAPLKAAVLELPGGIVQVRWTDPAAQFARYDSPPLAALGRELAAACVDIADAIVRRNGTQLT